LQIAVAPTVAATQTSRTTVNITVYCTLTSTDNNQHDAEG